MELSDKEKALLCILLARVGGKPDGPRGTADKLLKRIGFEYDLNHQEFADMFPGYGIREAHGAIYFEEV